MEINFCFQRIQIAVALIGQGSQAVGQMFSSIFFPIIPFLLQMVRTTFIPFLIQFVKTANITFCNDF